MQQSLKQPGNKRLIYFGKRRNSGACPVPETIARAHAVISEQSLELSLVLKYLWFLVFQHYGSGINCIFQVKLLVFVLCSSGSFAPSTEP